ncbi:MAG: PAS domain-containing protein [Desulfobulbaceae bacterium]|nr:PAS domain-containing protein [Desulfobulbaceae bacterium]
MNHFVNNKNLFHQLVTLSPAGIFLTDEQGNYQYVNERWCQMTGLTPEKAKGRGWVQGLHPDDREKIAAAWYKIPLSQKKWSAEFRFLNKEGQTTWVYGLANSLKDAKGNVTGYIGINTDITAQKLAVIKLQENEAKFRTIADYTYNWEYWMSPEKKCLYSSPSCEGLSGYRVDEFMQDPNLFLSIVHPDDKEKITRHLEDELAAREPVHLVFKIITRQGEERWVAHSCQPVFDEQGIFMGRRASNRNFTYRKKMEMQLEENENRLRQILHACSDGFWDWDLVNEKVSWGRDWHRLLGYADEDFKKTPLTWEELVHPEDKPKTLKKINKHIDGLTSRYEAEFRMKNKAGEWQWLLSRGKAVEWDEENRPLRIVGSLTDITHRKNFEIELKNAYADLEKRIKERTVELEETNVALRVLLKKRSEDRSVLEQQVIKNVTSLVEPYIMKLKKSKLTKEQKIIVDILQSNLEEVTSPFTSTLSSKFMKLTPSEIQVANLVKQGKRTKDIAELLSLAPGTINIHRKNIRKKLELTHQGVNLQTVLSSLS